MKNWNCTLRVILKRLRRKEEFLSRIVDLFFPAEGGNENRPQDAASIFTF
jgi:hypothetical protein